MAVTWVIRKRKLGHFTRKPYPTYTWDNAPLRPPPHTRTHLIGTHVSNSHASVPPYHATSSPNEKQNDPLASVRTTDNLKTSTWLGVNYPGTVKKSDNAASLSRNWVWPADKPLSLSMADLIDVWTVECILYLCGLPLCCKQVPPTWRHSRLRWPMEIGSAASCCSPKKIFYVQQFVIHPISSHSADSLAFAVFWTCIFGLKLQVDALVSFQ